MKRQSNDQRIERTAIAILNYFRDHPDAEDTTAGIAQWWVGENPEIVGQTLKYLESQRAVQKVGEVYKARQKKLTEED
ncbi:MAG: hypothetical protein ACOCWK_08635 [Tangfeifania sp.]